MPANTTPEYKKAEKAFRRARDPHERLDLLKEMLRAIPKHKGTEHLQADIKSRIKELTDELSGPQKTGARGGPPLVIKPEGAGQIALLGPPNTGKSALHVALTGSHSQIGEYAYTTQYPQPGMMMYEDVTMQLVDLPPITLEHPVTWIANALQPADGCLLVVDLGDTECIDAVLDLHSYLAERKVVLTGVWPAPAIDDLGDEMDPFTIVVPTLLVANKADEIADLDEELRVFEEITGLDYPFLAVSATQGQGLDALARWLFERLEIVRVYTKIPGQAADMGTPFTVRQGGTVEDVAYLVHKDIGRGLKYARVWGKESFDGQQVGREHVVCDGDVLELHV